MHDYLTIDPLPCDQECAQVLTPRLTSSSPADLAAIHALNDQFERRYDSFFSTEPVLTRGLVSFQANKTRAVYRWYKFKEAFSAGLIEFLLTRYRIEKGTLLDPFAGSGTSKRSAPDSVLAYI